MIRFWFAVSRKSPWCTFAISASPVRIGRLGRSSTRPFCTNSV
jgi:hypothetical protein